MTVSSEVSRVDYTATGSDSTYQFAFVVYSESDLLVTVRDTSNVEATYALTTNYTVALASAVMPSAGSITLVAGNLTADYIITIRRKLALTQTTDLHGQGSTTPATLESRYDKLLMQVQQLQDQVSRSLRLFETEPGTPAKTVLPFATTRASKVCAFDSSGNITAISAVPAGSLAFTAIGEDIAEAANASAVRDLLGATSGLFPGSVIAAKTISPSNLTGSAIYQVFQARLTGTTGTPVPASVITSVNIYVTPYGGDKIALYDGTDWRLFTLTEVTASVPNTTATNYDVFIYDAPGLTLDIVAWSNDTTRATALATQNGVYVKTGATGRRYVGSFRTGDVSGTTNDTTTLRHIWNYYNRVRRNMMVKETTNTWTYTTDTFRQVNAAATNQLDILQGVAEDWIKAQAFHITRNPTTNVRVVTGIGIDSTTANSADITASCVTQVANLDVNPSATLVATLSSAGRHTLVWLERSAATGTTTWVGDDGAASNRVQSGLMAEIMG